MSAHIECADSHRAVAFVGRQAEIIHVEIEDIDRYLPGGLRSIAVDQCTNSVGQCGGFRDRLDDTRFIVNEHHRRNEQIVP